jgi:hypothetical protein
VLTDGDDCHDETDGDDCHDETDGDETDGVLTMLETSTDETVCPYEVMDGVLEAGAGV